jgi:hypothetical protein
MDHAWIIVFPGWEGIGTPEEACDCPKFCGGLQSWD